MSDQKEIICGHILPYRIQFVDRIGNPFFEIWAYAPMREIAGAYIGDISRSVIFSRNPISQSATKITGRQQRAERNKLESLSGNSKALLKLWIVVFGNQDPGDQAIPFYRKPEMISHVYSSEAGSSDFFR